MEHNHIGVPSTIVIGPYIYNVEFCQEVYTDKGAKAFGRVDYGNHTIQLDANSSSDRLRVVLVHEILHAILEACGFEDDEKMSEESLILRASPWITQVLMDNRDLREYLDGG